MAFKLIVTIRTYKAGNQANVKEQLRHPPKYYLKGINFSFSTI